MGHSACLLGDSGGASLPRAGDLDQRGVRAGQGKSRPCGHGWGQWCQAGWVWGSRFLGTLMATGSNSPSAHRPAGSGSKRNGDKFRFFWCLQVIIGITATGCEVIKFP